MKIKKNDLEIILQEGEGQTIEFKESFSQSLAKDMVAFANALGGRIFIGVDDKGKVRGLNITNRLKSQVMDIARHSDPSIVIKLQVLGQVMIVNVEEGDNKPYQCKEGFFLRQGPTSQKLSRDEIIRFYIDETKIRFDTQINKNFNYLTDFDKKKLKQYLEAINMTTQHKTEDILINLGVAEKKQGDILFNNAGILLFSKEPCRFFQSAYVDAIVFKGTDRVDIIDRKIFRNGLFENLNKVYTYLQEHLNVRYEYGQDWRRRNIYELPLEALREATVNALIHRDYFMSGANISVCIFDDRVEVVSPGGLPKPLTVKDLGKKSKRRNETIADLFSRLDFVEKAGTGVRKMRQWMREHKLKPPKIEADGFFTIIFKRSQELAKNVPKMSLKNVPKMSLKGFRRIKRKEVILSTIRKKQSFTLITLARELGVARKTVIRDIEDLKKEGKIRFVGSKRTGYYELKK